MRVFAVKAQMADRALKVEVDPSLAGVKLKCPGSVRGHALIDLPLPLGSVDAPVVLGPFLGCPSEAVKYPNIVVAPSRSGHEEGQRVSAGGVWGWSPSRSSLCFVPGAAPSSLDC